ncbi:MAG: glycosyltransferase family 4 protein [Chthoniobacterales bacterium]
MRIFYDGYIFSAQRNGGISRYFANLIRHLPIEYTPDVLLGREVNGVEIRHAKLRLRRDPFHAVKPRRVGDVFSSSFNRLHDARGKYDVFHPTYHFRLPEQVVRRGRRPAVVTVFDMIPELYAESLDPDGREAAAKKLMIEAADAILCISESTKADLQARHRVPDDRITVTHLASDLSQDIAFGEESVPERPYVLFMGNRAVYKNFARTLLALSRVVQSWPDLKLALVGDAMQGKETELVRALELQSNVVHVGYVPDAHLAKLYRCSAALVYPSLYEGFGIPPLEAMACGTVVISSDRSSLPEVIGDAAIRVNPESINEMAEAMLSLRDLSDLRRNQLIARGFDQVKLFSWDETARQTVKVYQSVAVS